MSMTDAQTAAFQKRLRFLGTKQFHTVAVPGSRPGFALVCLGDVDGLQGLGGRQCALRCLRRQCRARTSHLACFDVLHPVITQEITVMLKCLVPLKKTCAIVRASA